jgi:hypothetical protein
MVEKLHKRCHRARKRRLQRCQHPDFLSALPCWCSVCVLLLPPHPPTGSVHTGEEHGGLGPWPLRGRVVAHGMARAELGERSQRRRPQSQGRWHGRDVYGGLAGRRKRVDW